MTRALLAAFRSKALALRDRCRLTDDEAVTAGLGFAVTHARRAGYDVAELHRRLDSEALADDDPATHGGAK